MYGGNNYIQLWPYVTLKGKLIKEWLSKRENVLWVVLLTVHLVPIWMFDYNPSMDGPSHLNNATVIREFFYPNNTLFREYYSLNLRLFPNWSGYVALIGLMFVFSAGVAEKIFLSGYILLLPISARYALKAISPDKSFLAFLIIPLTFNFSFHMGFYNFCSSLPVFFFLLGYWLRNQKHFTIKNGLSLMGLSLLLYFCHIFSLVMAYSLIAVLIASSALKLASQQFTNKQFAFSLAWQELSSRLHLALVAFSPAVILTIWFIKTQRGKVSQGMIDPKHFISAFVGVTSYQISEIPLTCFFVGMIFLVMLYHIQNKIRQRALDDNDGFFLAFSAFVTIFIIAPDETYGGGFVHDRLRLFVLFALMLWFAAQSYQQILRKLIIWISTSVAILQLGLYTAKDAELNNYLHEYMSGIKLITANSTLLPLCFEPKGLSIHQQKLSTNVQPFRHAAGYIAAERRVIDFTNYEGNEDYFPVQFRPERNPYTHIGQVEDLPSSLDFLTYPARTGGTVDYVLIWGANMGQVNNDKYTQNIINQLEVGYDLVYISPQHGLMHLYKRKKETDGKDITRVRK